MTDNTQRNNMNSSTKESKGLTNIRNTENSLRVESLQNDNEQATESLVERMIGYQEEKVDPGVSVTKGGSLNLREDNKK